jgi:hypothetical protein
MNAKDFIEKWLVGYEDLEHKAELSIEMETDLIEYANQPKWISVEDRLPESLRNVLVVYDNEIDGYITRGFYHGGQWEVQSYAIAKHNCKVTHWQPLPEKP